MAQLFQQILAFLLNLTNMMIICHTMCFVFLTAGGDGCVNDGKNIQENKTGKDENLVIELDDVMEDELCKLWDASMNEVRTKNSS